MSYGYEEGGGGRGADTARYLDLDGGDVEGEGAILEWGQWANLVGHARMTWVFWIQT